MDVSGINFDEDFSEQQAEKKNGEKNGNTSLSEYVMHRLAEGECFFSFSFYIVC